MVQHIADLSHFLFTYAALIESKLPAILLVFLLTVIIFYLTILCIADYFTPYRFSLLSKVLEGGRRNHGLALTFSVSTLALNGLLVAYDLFGGRKLRK